MAVIYVKDAAEPGLEPYFRLTEAQLRNRLEPEKGIFIAESPKVIRLALEKGLEPVSLLCEERHLALDAADLLSRLGEMPVYVGERELLASITGYTLTRGVLCAMRRPVPPLAAELLREANRVAVLEGVVDSTNVGAIFRSAAALGMDAVLLSSTCCDPLNRRSVRVSMGTVFQVPWLVTDDWLTLLRERAFAVYALALREDALPIDAPELKEAERIALVLGAEGDGLSNKTVAGCDRAVIIPMRHGVDSLNVAAASAVAFWEMRK